jgi:hypothetical protein
MSSTPGHAHLDNHHRDTLAKIFQHPAGRNIEWRAVLSLLAVVGTVEERHDGKFAVTVGAETEILQRPLDKDVDAQALVDLRRMLRNAGYAPTSQEGHDL